MLVQYLYTIFAVSALETGAPNTRMVICFNTGRETGECTLKTTRWAPCELKNLWVIKYGFSGHYSMSVNIHNRKQNKNYFTHLRYMH